MMAVVCPSVCHMSRPNWQQKGLGSPKLAGWKPITRVTREPIKGQVARPINVVTDNASYAGHGYYNFLKISLI